MKALNNNYSVALIIVLAAMAESAYGQQQPPDVVVSDAEYNTAMGSGALTSVTPYFSEACNCYLVYSNTASGNATLYENTTGSYNTASGDSALASNTTGSGNTASGFLALVANTTGGSNSAFGFWALGRNTSGYNTAQRRRQHWVAYRRVDTQAREHRKGCAMATPH
jgi:hypothetical protein